MRGTGRKALAGLAFAAALLGAGCGAGNAVKSKTLNVYSFAAYFPPDLIQRFEDRFGVQVNISTYPSNEEMLRGLAARPRAYDVIVPSDYAVEILRRDRKLEPLDLAKIENFRKNVDRGFQNPYFDPGTVSNRTPYRDIQTAQGKFSIPYQYGTTGIAYDATKVKVPIRTWEDLFRPQFAGRIVLLNDSREVLGAALVGLGYSKNDTSRAHIRKAAAAVEAIKPRVVRFDSDFPERALADGKAVAGLMFSGNADAAVNGNADEGLRANPNIRYVLPDPGGGIWFDNLAVPKNAPHKDAAFAFLNFVLEPAEGADITRTYGFSSPNKKARELIAKQDPALAADPIVNPSQKTLDRLSIVKDVGASARASYDEAWAGVTAGAKVVG